MKSKSLIEKQVKRKKNSKLVDTIIATKKNKKWQKIAGILTNSTRKNMYFNLNEISNQIKDEKIVLIPGKVLSQGEINKKIKIIALNFSEKAKEKLLKSSCEVSDILNEIKSNPDFKDIKILTK